MDLAALREKRTWSDADRKRVKTAFDPLLDVALIAEEMVRGHVPAPTCTCSRCRLARALDQ